MSNLYGKYPSITRPDGHTDTCTCPEKEENMITGTCRASSLTGVYLCQAEYISASGEGKGFWLAADQHHPGQLLRYYDLLGLITFWLNDDRDNKIVSIDYDAEGHHNTSYPDRVIANEKARLVVKELTR